MQLSQTDLLIMLLPFKDILYLLSNIAIVHLSKQVLLLLFCLFFSELAQLIKENRTTNM